ncbi:MAG: beta-ketoacyl synthase N-terminal-like domain-containing protein [Mycobacteriales bacterium]
MFDDPVKPPPIAVVGLGALMPGEPGVQGFWRTIVAGRDQITDVPASRWLVEDYYDPDPLAPDKTYARRGAFLPEIDFDPMAFGIVPNNLPATDSAQLLALLVAEQVLTDACGAQPRLAVPERAQRTGPVQCRVAEGCVGRRP